jgi:hypothetical protein
MQTQNAPHIENNQPEFSGLPLNIEVQAPKISSDQFKPVFAKRKAMLESVKDLISIKFYQGLESKIKQEEETALELTNSNYLAKKRQSRFTYVLDSQYFEQRFI